jgi:hypothetical protein
MPIYHNHGQLVAIPFGYYYFGGYDMSKKEIKVLMVEPGKHPKVTMLKDDLDSLQKAVSIGADYQGLIEIISIGNGDCLFCNEEGKLIGLEGNRRLGNDIIVGVFYILSEDLVVNLVSLSDKKIQYYTELFWEPERFDRTEIEATLTCHFL